MMSADDQATPARVDAWVDGLPDGMPRNARKMLMGTGAHASLAKTQLVIGWIEAMLVLIRRLSEQILSDRESLQLLHGDCRRFLDDAAATRALRSADLLDRHVGMVLMGQLTAMMEFKFDNGARLDEATKRYLSFIISGNELSPDFEFIIDVLNHQLIASASILGLTPKDFEIDNEGLTPDGQLALAGWLLAGGFKFRNPAGWLSPRTIQAVKQASTDKDSSQA